LHELSLAQGVADAAAEEASKNGSARVVEIDLEVGELAQVDTKALQEALSLLMTGPVLGRCVVRISTAPASFICAKCSAGWGMTDALKQLEQIPDQLRVREPESKEFPLHFFPQLYSSFIHCPKCGSADVSAAAGEDIRIRRLGLE